MYQFFFTIHLGVVWKLQIMVQTFSSTCRVLHVRFSIAPSQMNIENEDSQLNSLQQGQGLSFVQWCWPSPPFVIFGVAYQSFGSILESALTMDGISQTCCCLWVHQSDKTYCQNPWAFDCSYGKTHWWLLCRWGQQWIESSRQAARTTRSKGATWDTRTLWRGIIRLIFIA